jgi:hypothetical protein
MSHPTPNQSSGPLPAAVAERVELACDRYEEDLQAGRASDIVAHLSGMPEDSLPEAFSALLRVELSYLADVGRSPSAQNYLARYPDYTSSIAEVFGLSAKCAAPPVTATDDPAETGVRADDGLAQPRGARRRAAWWLVALLALFALLIALAWGVS